MKFFKYCWDLCYATSKKIGAALFHLIFITLFCTLPHELGHAIVSNLFSWKVDYITIGFPRSSEYWFSFNFFKYEIRLNKIPLIGGTTHWRSSTGRGEIFVLLAGILANLLMVLLAWWAESKIENKFWKKVFKMIKEYNLLTIIYNFLNALWSPNCDVRRIFYLLFCRK